MFENRLRGKVYSKHPTVAEFAKAIGWSYNKAFRIVNNKQDPSPTEIVEIAMVLELSKDDVFDIFFNTNSKMNS